MRRIIIAAVAALLWAAPAGAQGGLRSTPNGFCTLSSMSGSTLLSTCAGGIPSGTNYAVICAKAQAVNWRDDGTAPTAADGGGMTLPAGSCMPYNGNFTALRFIQLSGGAVLQVSFYRGT